jgi:hypothetical protein
MQEHKDIPTAQSVGATTRQPKRTFEQMLNSIRESLNNVASSDDEQDGYDEQDEAENTETGKLSDYDEHTCVMGTISRTVQHRMESFQQKHMRLDELMQPGSWDASNHFCERDMMYETAELKVPAVVQP